jgi:inosose dehydratase
LWSKRPARGRVIDFDVAVARLHAHRCIMSPRTLSRRGFLTALPAGLSVLTLARAARSAGQLRPRVGCQANGFPIKPGDFAGLLDALKRMRELGYTGFECNIRFVEGEFGSLAAARKRIADTGVEFIGTHMNMNNARPETFPQSVQNVAALGASYIVMSGPGLDKEGKFTRDALQEKAASLAQLGQTCRKAGLRLAYHNHNPEFANGNAEMNGLADATDREHLSFLMDAGHAKLGGGDPAAFLRRHSDRIVGCHLKTYKEQVQVPLGQGDWDFQDLAAAVTATRWAGWLIVEAGGGPRPGHTAALGPDREQVRRVFGV